MGIWRFMDFGFEVKNECQPDNYSLLAEQIINAVGQVFLQNIVVIPASFAAAMRCKRQQILPGKQSSFALLLWKNQEKRRDRAGFALQRRAARPDADGGGAAAG